MKVEKFKEFDFTKNDLDNIKICSKHGVFFGNPPQSIGNIVYKVSFLEKISHLEQKNTYLLKKITIFLVATIFSIFLMYKMVYNLNYTYFDFSFFAHIFAGLFGVLIIFGISFFLRNKLTVNCYYIGENGIHHAYREKFNNSIVNEITIYFKNSTLKAEEKIQEINFRTTNREQNFEFNDTKGNTILLSIERDEYTGRREDICEYLLCKKAVEAYYLYKNANKALDDE